VIESLPENCTANISCFHVAALLKLIFFPLVHFFWWVAVCDPKSLLFLFGTQLDYIDGIDWGWFLIQQHKCIIYMWLWKSFAA